METNEVKKCVDDLKKLRGLPPYNTPSNIVLNDGRFAKNISDNYSTDVIEMAEIEIAKSGEE